MKKTIKISVIADAIEEAMSGWQHFYNVVTGEVKGIPDWTNDYADRSEFEEDMKEIEESEDYLRLPDQKERDDFSVMEEFAVAKDSDALLCALRGRRPFRSFKYRAIQIGMIQDYYTYHAGECIRKAKVWCEENEIPYIVDDRSQAKLTAAGKAVPPPEAPITMLLRYTGENGSARRFAEEMLASGTVAAIRAEEGNLGYEYFLSLEDAETLLLIDRWEDQAALDAHHASPMMATIASLREKYDLHMTAERLADAEASDEEARFIRK